MKSTFLLLAVIFSVSCAKPAAIEEPISKSSSYLVVNTLKLKDVGGGFDYEAEITNTSDRFVIFKFNEAQCYKGGHRGYPKRRGFVEYLFNLKPGQTKAWRFRCIGKYKGDVTSYRVVIDGLYDDPTRDGRTLGEVLEKKIDIVINKKTPESWKKPEWFNEL